MTKNLVTCTNPCLPPNFIGAIATEDRSGSRGLLQMASDPSLGASRLKDVWVGEWLDRWVFNVTEILSTRNESPEQETFQDHIQDRSTIRTEREDPCSMPRRKRTYLDDKHHSAVHLAKVWVIALPSKASQHAILVSVFGRPAVAYVGVAARVPPRPRSWKRERASRYLCERKIFSRQEPLC